MERNYDVADLFSVQGTTFFLASKGALYITMNGHQLLFAFSFSPLAEFCIASFEFDSLLKLMVY